MDNFTVRVHGALHNKCIANGTLSYTLRTNKSTRSTPHDQSLYAAFSNSRALLLSQPDQYIQALNADISTIEEKMESCLPADRLNLVFGGISVLMAHILIANTRYIRHFNDVGNRKMVRNILALQQNLTNIALPEESGLDKARGFYEMYDLGADGILKHIAEHGAAFSFDNYRRMMDFIYSGSGQTGDLGAGRAASLTEARQSDQYETHVRRLRELLSQAQPVQAGPAVAAQRPASARAPNIMA
ncbi:exocyst subunit [Coemansia pectinata]|uniref:Exocyst complex component Sec8 n=1 Tax=Coemansia pectinata TaxID=1052879 RepID=A0A9W8LD75_9FUNG|nr:exocyst subunit [Coemansia pectinata]